MSDLSKAANKDANKQTHRFKCLLGSDGAAIMWSAACSVDSDRNMSHLFVATVAPRVDQPGWVAVVPRTSGPPEQQQRRPAVPVREQLNTHTHFYCKIWTLSPPRQHDGRSNMAAVCTGRSGRETAFKYEKSLMCDDELDGDFVLLFFFYSLYFDASSFISPPRRSHLKWVCLANGGVQLHITHTQQWRSRMASKPEYFWSKRLWNAMV